MKLISDADRRLIELAYLLMPGQATDVAAAFNRRRAPSRRLASSTIRRCWATAKREGRLPKGRRKMARTTLGPVLMTRAAELVEANPRLTEGTFR